jgi:pimeloyl-ACP methyl ester carboxylesterase
MALFAAGAYLWSLFHPSAATPPADPASTAVKAGSRTPTSRPSLSPGAMPDRPVVPAPAGVGPAGFTDPPPGQGLDRYVQQTVDWKACQSGTAKGFCASVAVPLDYAEPDRQAITLAVFRRPAKTPGLGPLFINPGGPGAPGRAAAAWLDADALPGFDLIGWDPRGTGQSTPVVCSDDPAVDRLLDQDQSPDALDEQVALLDAWRDYGADCLERSGELIWHIGTRDTVADLDLMRQLLGAPAISYLGYSYGTYIGALYADTYPDRVSRMVLDSPVDIGHDDSSSQARGFEQAYQVFADWCGPRPACLVGRDAAAVIHATVDFIAGLDAAPLPVGDRWLTQTKALDGLMAQLYADESAYPALGDSLAAAMAGDGEPLLRAADSLWQRHADGHYSGLLPAFTAIRCLDHADDGIVAAFDEWAAESRLAPLFGAYGGLDVACVRWPAPAQPESVIQAADAPPILIVGALGDSATPYAYARQMTDRLPSAVLVTYTGAGHATYGSGRSGCVDTWVHRYLNDGQTPTEDVTCQ